MGNERGRIMQRTGVRAASESSIEIDFIFKTRRCKERLKLKPTSTNLKRADIHRAAILDAIERGTFNYSVTFPESKNRFIFAEYQGEGYLIESWLETWYERQKKHLKASTLDGYRKIIFNVLIPEFGHKTLTEVRRSDVRNWCDRQECSNKRLSNVQSVLRAALQAALDDDLIENNPLYGWVYSRKEAPSPVDEIDPFDMEEQRAILASCRDPQHENLFRFAFWTGLRTSELAALEWGDIDWVRKIVRVSRAQTQASEEHEKTKTRRGTRDIKLLPSAIDALTAQKAYSFIANGAVFLNPLYGKAWAGDQAIRASAWIPALKKANVRYRNPYQTRHTYASMMLSSCENAVWVAGQMGHADTAMIYRNYGRWIESESSNSGEKAAKLFAEETNNNFKDVRFKST